VSYTLRQVIVFASGSGAGEFVDLLLQFSKAMLTVLL
jgi:hypothetical protein